MKRFVLPCLAAIGAAWRKEKVNVLAEGPKVELPQAIDGPIISSATI